MTVLRTRMRRVAGWLAVMLPALFLPAFPATAAMIEGSGAILQGLDKVTARVSEIDAPLQRLVRFGTLEIIVRACRKTPPEEPPESVAFLEIRDAKPGEPTVALFTGWMFASSPALSALEHPVYDVWVLDCTLPADAPIPLPADPAPEDPASAAPDNGAITPTDPPRPAPPETTPLPPPPGE